MVESANKNVKDFYHEGVVDFKIGDYENAVENFKRILIDDSNNECSLHKDALFYLGNSLIALCEKEKDNMKARGYLEQAIRAYYRFLEIQESKN